MTAATRLLVFPRLSKASQLGFTFGPRKEVQEPGSRGGRGYFDEHGHWQYGTPPAGIRAEERPPLLPWDVAEGRWPKRAKTYADATPEAPVQDYEVLEPEFIAHYRERMLVRARRNLDGWERQSAQRRRGTGQASNQVIAWRVEVQRWSDPNPAQVESQREAARKVYAKLVKEAISKGKPVPAPVITQRPEFRTAQNARARYEKGRHTSFANVSLAVNRTMQDRRGYKAKRQDGAMLTMGQLAEIEEGIDAIEAVTGPLVDVLRKVDVTIAHTNGKQPFLRKAGGLYSPDEVTVTVGIAGCSALAHEMAHMVDHAAGKALSKRRRIFRKNRTIESDSLAELDARDSGNADTQLARTLLQRARASMTNERQVRLDMRTQVKAVPGSERDRIQKVHVMLGPYWSEPCELWARLVEQYVATARRGKGRSFAHDTAEWYEAAPGWWNPEAFAQLAPTVKTVLDHRLAALRGQTTTGGPPADPALVEGMAGASSTRSVARVEGRIEGLRADRPPPRFTDTTRPLTVGEEVYIDVGGMSDLRGHVTPPEFRRARVTRVEGDRIHYDDAPGSGGGGFSRRHGVYAYDFTAAPTQPWRPPG